MIGIVGTTLIAPARLEPAALRAALEERQPVATEPERLAKPPAFPAGQWRRMSRLARLAATAVVTITAGRDDLDRMALVWGTSVGEIVPTAKFLTRLFEEGAARATPMAFQNSVYNAPAGHISIALGMRGPSETVSAGGATGVAALQRGMDLVAAGAPSALVVVADDRNPTTGRAWELTGGGRPPGELCAAVLLAPGRGIQVRLGLAGAPLFARAAALPNEGPLEPVPGAIAPERALGLNPCLGLAAVIAASAGGGTVLDCDGPSRFAVTVG